MRFGLPRSPSPSPVRRPKRRTPYRSTSTYGLFSDSESDSSSGDSWLDSESESEGPSERKHREGVPPEQHAVVRDTVQAIRVRALYSDPYEDWEREARKQAFHTARRQQAAARAQLDAARSAARDRTSQTQSAALAKELDAVANHLKTLGLKEKESEKARDARWAELDRARWKQIDEVIRVEEEKVRVALEKERREKEEAEKARREEEERRRAEEEARRKREIEKRAADEERARREKEKEEAEKKKKEEEEAEMKRREEMERAMAQELQKQEGARKSLGMTSPMEDWVEARRMLKELKQGPIAMVKGATESKKLWNERRRKITHRVGQLTNDPQSIADVSRQIIEAVQNPPLPDPIRIALLSTLAKAVILQAETEVVAEARSALPLGQMTANLLSALDGFADIFWIKLVQRTGGWIVPASVPQEDVDGKTFDKPTYAKVRGHQPDEGATEYMARIAGVMRVYFAVLHANVGGPLARQFQRPRFWAFFARMASQPRLLASPVAPELLGVALDIGGADAKRIWGSQWVKMLSFFYDGIETKRIGGGAPESQGARVRLQLQIERVANA